MEERFLLWTEGRYKLQKFNVFAIYNIEFLRFDRSEPVIVGIVGFHSFDFFNCEASHRHCFFICDNIGLAITDKLINNT